MTDTERIVQLEAEWATPRAYVGELLAENAALKRRLTQDRHNSSKPPASDGLARRPRFMRHPSGKRPGGQPRHMDHTLAVVEQPDAVEPHVPAVCAKCPQPLDGVPGVVVERRQVRELPPLLLAVTEPQALAVTCPAYHAVTRCGIPADVRAPAQYGPRLRALAVSLHQKVSLHQ